MAQDDGALPQVVDPNTGNLTTVSPQDAATLSQIGYQAPSPEQLAAKADEEKFSTPGQQAITALEGGLGSATLGLSTKLEKSVLGVPSANIRARREINPIPHTIGQIGGLAATAPLGEFGAQGLLEGAGLAGGEAVGLGAEAAGENAAKEAVEYATTQGATEQAARVAGDAAKAQALAPFSTIEKIGSKAVKSAIETGLFQSGDEVSKMFSDDPQYADPSHAIQTALINVGLASALGGATGGALGAVSPLWQATNGTGVGKLLGAISDKMQGIDSAIPDSMNEAIDRAGIDIPPEVKAGLSDDPTIRNHFAVLRQAMDSGSAEQFQTSLKNFYQGVSESAAGAMGKSPDEIASLSELSPYEAGQKAQKSISDEVMQKYGPIAEKYDAVAEKYKNVPLTDDVKANIAEKIGQVAQEQGWNLKATSDEANEIQGLLKDVPTLKTLEDLRKFQSVTANDLSRKQLWAFNKSIQGVLNGAEESMVDAHLSTDSPELFADHVANKQAYGQMKGVIDDLNARLHVPYAKGPKTFINNLSEVNPEKIISRLSGKSDAGLLNLLNTEFPQTSSMVQGFERDNLLKAAAKNAGEGQVLNTKTLTNKINAMSPEYRNFVIGSDAQTKLSSLRMLTDKLESISRNNSNTAPFLAKMWGQMPSSVLAGASMLMGHNPAVGFVLGQLGKYMGRDAPDAARLALLKFMGSDSPLSSGGLKAAFDLINHTISGENILTKATKALFNAGETVLPPKLIPDSKQKEKLDEHLKTLQSDPSPLFQSGGQFVHYLPAHGQALAEMNANATNYLNSQRPVAQKSNPLDQEPQLSGMVKAQWDRTLELAQQPAAVLVHVKEGTLTARDMQDIRSMYPGFYQRASSKIMQELIENVHNEKPIPYKTRLSMSQFVGQPLDSTMTPGAILSNQGQMGAGQSPSQEGPKPRPKTGQMKSLNKLASSTATPGQNREMEKAAFNS